MKEERYPHVCCVPFTLSVYVYTRSKQALSHRGASERAVCSSILQATSVGVVVIVVARAGVQNIIFS
jgi:hypothetical protein